MNTKYIILISVFLFNIITVQSSWCDRVSTTYTIPYQKELSICSSDLDGPLNVTANFAIKSDDQIYIFIGYYPSTSSSSCLVNDQNIKMVLHGQSSGDYVGTYSVPDGNLPAVVIQCTGLFGCNTTVSGNFCESSSNSLRVSLLILVIGTIISLIF